VQEQGQRQDQHQVRPERAEPRQDAEEGADRQLRRRLIALDLREELANQLDKRQHPCLRARRVPEPRGLYLGWSPGSPLRCAAVSVTPSRAMNPGLAAVLLLASPARQAAPLKSFDDAMENQIREYRIPGAALAVAKDGRLVLARGYGLADVDAGSPVEAGSLFRIASISKPITA